MRAYIFLYACACAYMCARIRYIEKSPAPGETPIQELDLILLIEIGFPKTVLVAIGINFKHYFIFEDGEDGLGFISRLEEMEGSAFVGE